MKKLNKTTLLFAVLLSVGCSSSYTDGVDGVYFKTENGEVFYLEHWAGNVYAPVKVDVDKINKEIVTINKLTDE